jgi:DNA-binding NtrC family response regulator
MRGRILIVEDNADWRELLAGLLRREGHDVDAAATLPEAQALVEQTRDLDLAIVDIRLVESDEANQQGMQLLAGIHACQPLTRVILITGHGTMELQRRAFREFKAFDFFRKEEFDGDEFRKSVYEAIDLAGRERAARHETDYMRGHRYENWQKTKGG